MGDVKNEKTTIKQVENLITNDLCEDCPEIHFFVSYS